MVVTMGLDNYWTPGGSDWDSADPIQLEFDPPLSLQHGTFSRTGAGSFRGQAYFEFLLAVTGVSIYTEIVPNSDIRLMAKELRNTEYEEAMEMYASHVSTRAEKPEISRQEYHDLCRMFSAYGEAGAQLEGWW